MASEERAPRPPSLIDALLPVLVLIGLIALTIALFGVSATDGPLQVGLLLSAAFASLMALKNGYTSAAVADAAIGGVTTAMSAIFILLAVGALIGTWNMAGTIPTIVDYGVQLLNPTIFYVTTAAICALVGMVTGSSWTTAGTLGVAFAAIDTLFSRGGMASLLTTIWLVLAALSFAAIMEHAGFLERLLQPVVAHAPTRGRLIAAVNASGIGLNTIAGDQYVADVLPARMLRGEFDRRGLAPQVLARAVEDSGTVTSSSFRGTRAARTSPACSACRRLRTSRTASSTSSARSSTCCTGSSGSRCRRRRRKPSRARRRSRSRSTMRR